MTPTEKIETHCRAVRRILPAGRAQDVVHVSVTGQVRIDGPPLDAAIWRPFMRSERLVLWDVHVEGMRFFGLVGESDAKLWGCPADVLMRLVSS